MSPRTSKQFEEIRSEKKKIILDTALKLFANEGFHATSISKIAQTAKISKGLMYNYFESKEALLKAIIFEATANGWKYFDPDQDGILTSDEFIFYIQKSFQSVKENTNYWKLYSALLLQPNVFELLNDDFSQIFEKYTVMLYSFFTQRGCKDPEGESLIFSSMIKGAIIQYISAPQYFPIELFEKKVIDFYADRLNFNNTKEVI